VVVVVVVRKMSDEDEVDEVWETDMMTLGPILAR
jgi:hypothetical protein